RWLFQQLKPYDRLPSGAEARQRSLDQLALRREAGLLSAAEYEEARAVEVQRVFEAPARHTVPAGQLTPRRRSKGRWTLAAVGAIAVLAGVPALVVALQGGSGASSSATTESPLAKRVVDLFRERGLSLERDAA